ncbi:NADH-quinone oxidoreductase subunit M [Gordonia sp. PDNC005]|jgi:NADH-quinone oxidoreductase subunit M|uniref:NADH-quinone oxidoreductase subunit M n=1 Tax=unclassified Gordonia (in: high G+C Gram-positive bacteria) TaxID=2657482 RepID=UPI0019654CEE|nr:NADH-quinone oxidoreductase subunit M [Gordonia sp. PDNC005]QRY63711.1 NADH-quinone oxidoreductase subunit M [Gordonia sp. PDNC005]
MTMPWLTVLWLLPAVASAVVMFLPADRAHNAKVIGVGAALLVLVWSLIVAARFEPGGRRFQMTEDLSWIPQFGARYSLGLDGVGLALILLTTVLTPLLLLAGWRDADGPVGKTVHIYVALLLSVEAMVLMSFVATDVLLFYVFFEAMLIPMYFLIGGFGTKGPGVRAERSRAAVQFLLYNLFGGLIMLAAVIGLYVVAGKFSFESISTAVADGTLEMSPTTQNLLFAGFVFAFAVKAPLWPLHTWLPDAAVSTTPAAAVMMMAVMDKVGTFAMLRYCVGLFPDASETFAPVLCTLAVVSIVYGAVMAIGQTDVMRLIAYTSISHFGFIVLGVFALTDQGHAGSTLYMVNHGISTAALFLIAGFLVSRRGSSLISDYGGVQRLAPVLSGTFLIAGLATLSLPGLGPFISEFLVLIGTFVRYPAAAVIASVALVLSAVYILWTYQRMMGGPAPDSADEQITDLGVREKLVVAPLIVLLFVLGFFPRIILDFVDPAAPATTSTTANDGADR